MVRTVSLLVLVAALSGCESNRSAKSDAGPSTDANVTPTPDDEQPDGLAGVPVTFHVTVPDGSPAEVYVEDAPFDQIGYQTFRGTRTLMTAQLDGTFTLTRTMTEGSVLRYRYVTDPAAHDHEETRFNTQSLIIREAVVVGPATTLNDQVIQWSFAPQPTQTLLDVPVRVLRSGAPVLDAVVTGPGGMFRPTGIHTISIMDRTNVEGRVVLQMPSGPARLVASYDGAGFVQTEVNVESGMSETTLTLPPAPLREIPIVIETTGLPSWATLHVFGSVPTLGYGYIFGSYAQFRGADLSSNDGLTWTGTAAIPEGGVEFFVSLGNEGWGREMNSINDLISFSHVIAPTTSEIRHAVAQWGPAGAIPVTFQVTVPVETPDEDVVYLMPSQPGPALIPMQQTAPDTWRVHLMMGAGSTNYSYTRAAISPYWSSNDAAGLRQLVVPATGTLDVTDVVASWERVPSDIFQPTLDLDPGTDPTFARGVTVPDFWNPDQLVETKRALRRLKGIGVEWVNIKPFSSMEPGDVPGYTRGELLRHVELIRGAGFKVYLEPQLPIPEIPIDADDIWWDDWFARYRLWILGFATIAEESGAEAFSPFTLQALPSTFIASNMDRWTLVLTDIKAAYSGLLIPDGTVGGHWSSPIHAFGAADDIGMLDSVDALFLGPSIQFAETLDEDPTVATLADRLEPLFTQATSYGLPVWLLLGTSSVHGALFDPNIANADLPGFPGPDWMVDFDEQTRILDAFFMARTSHPLVQGLFVWGHSYTAMVDNGPSVVGKPGEATLRSYFLP